MADRSGVGGASPAAGRRAGSSTGRLARMPGARPRRHRRRGWWTSTPSRSAFDPYGALAASVSRAARFQPPDGGEATSWAVAPVTAAERRSGGSRPVTMAGTWSRPRGGAAFSGGRPSATPVRRCGGACPHRVGSRADRELDRPGDAPPERRLRLGASAALRPPSAAGPRRRGGVRVTTARSHVRRLPPVLATGRCARDRRRRGPARCRRQRAGRGAPRAGEVARRAEAAPAWDRSRGRTA